MVTPSAKNLLMGAILTIAYAFDRLFHHGVRCTSARREEGLARQTSLVPTQIQPPPPFFSPSLRVFILLEGKGLGPDYHGTHL